MFYLIKRMRFLFLFIVLILFCYSKAVDSLSQWFLMKDMVFLFLIVISFLVIGHKEKWLMSVLLFIVIVELLLFLLQFYLGEQFVYQIKIIASVFFFFIMTVGCIYYTLQDETISVTTLFGSLSAYLFIGLFFAYSYILIQLYSPISFEGLDTENHASVIYFSFVILTTLGLGDIVPLTGLARTTVWLESYVGQCYMAIIIGQLIGRYVAEKMRKKG
jgi:voltage-gated potassium channel